MASAPFLDVDRFAFGLCVKFQYANFDGDSAQTHRRRDAQRPGEAEWCAAMFFYYMRHDYVKFLTVVCQFSTFYSAHNALLTFLSCSGVTARLTRSSTDAIHAH